MLLSNSVGPANLAGYCSQYKIPLVNFSSDLVFDGRKISPYGESDKVCPLNIYGHSKVCGERNVLRLFNEALVVRTSAFFGPWDEYNFIASLINNLTNNKTYAVTNDVVVSPTYVPDLANATLDLLIDQEKGIWHIASEGETTWAELARTVANKLNLDSTLIQEKSLNQMSYPAKRPGYSVLRSEKGMKLPSLYDALERYFREVNTTISNHSFQSNYAEEQPFGARKQ